MTKTLVATPDPQDKIRQSRYEWIAQTIKEYVDAH